MRAAPTLVVAALLLAGCGARDEAPLTLFPAATTGGGAVVDVPGYFVSLATDSTLGDTGGASAITLSGSIQDNNSESDILWIAGAFNGSSPLATNHTVTAAERASLVEPTSFGADGFKVWTGASDVDGLLLFRWRLVVPAGTAPGLYTMGASEGNNATTSWSGAIALTLQKASEVTVATQPVDASGAPQNASWGAWSATPGAAIANATNYLVLANTGQLAQPKVVVDFNELAFAGATDPAYTVPINGYVDFAWWEDSAPGGAPSRGTYNFTPSADGSVTIQLHGTGHVAYLTYRVRSLPAVLPNQTYAATFTVTDVGGDDGVNAMPDLVVESIATPAGILPGTPTTFVATIRNIGLGAASATSIPVRLVLDGSSLLAATYNASGPLASGARASVTSAAWSATKGSHSIVATVDPANATAETTEGNDVRSETFFVAPGLADPGFAYEDVGCDTYYDPSVDASIANASVRDGAYSATLGCLVIPPSVGDISTSKAVSYKSPTGVTVQVNVASTGGPLTLDGGSGVVRAPGVALASKTLLSLKSTAGDIDARGATLTSSGDGVSLTTASAGVVYVDNARASATKAVTLKAAGASLSAPGLWASAAQGIAATSRGTMDLRGAYLNATGTSSITLSTTISAQQVLVEGAEIHDVDNKATVSPTGDAIVGTPAFGAAA